MEKRWERGETIVHHEVWRDRVWAARPMTVVKNTADRLLLWIPQGTVRKVPAPPPEATGAERDLLGLPTEASHRGAIDNLETGNWKHVDHVWDVSSLWILRPGDWHATWVSWLPSGEHLGWYVNLQRPYRRTAAGIEAMDLMLDIVVETDRSWRWKDRREFEECVGRGLYDDETIKAVGADASSVIVRIEAGQDPFGTPWADWKPHPDWLTPTLPVGWADVP